MYWWNLTVRLGLKLEVGRQQSPVGFLSGNSSATVLISTLENGGQRWAYYASADGDAATLTGEQEAT